MSEIVLDASALLAILQGEPGAEVFSKHIELLEDTVMSAVNVAETYSKLVALSIDPDDAWRAVSAAIPAIVNYDAEQARLTGQLVPRTRALGLSLGDRACLALGMSLKAPVYTADRSWSRLRLGVKVHVIR